MTDLMDKYLTESKIGSPEHKLFIRFQNIRNKADKMFDQLYKMDKEVAMIQKKVKKLGLDDLTDHLDRPILNIHDDSWDVVWSMFSNR